MCLFCYALYLRITLSVLTVCHCGVFFLLRITTAHYTSLYDLLSLRLCICLFLVAHYRCASHDLLSLRLTSFVAGIGMIEIIVIGTHYRDCRRWPNLIISMSSCPITLLCRNPILHEYVAGVSYKCTYVQRLLSLSTSVRMYSN